jgi:hypothetical protein
MPATEAKTRMRMELKYCERCGGLWLRPAGSGLSYCPGCAKEMAQFPAVRLKPHDAGEEGRQP